MRPSNNNPLEWQFAILGLEIPGGPLQAQPFGRVPSVVALGSKLGGGPPASPSSLRPISSLPPLLPPLGHRLDLPFHRFFSLTLLPPIPPLSLPPKLLLSTTATSYHSPGLRHPARHWAGISSRVLWLREWATFCRPAAFSASGSSVMACAPLDAGLQQELPMPRKMSQKVATTSNQGSLPCWMP